MLLESYADSDAHLAHMHADGHGEFMGALMALIDSVEFVVLGEPTAEHAAALSSVPGASVLHRSREHLTHRSRIVWASPKRPRTGTPDRRPAADRCTTHARACTQHDCSAADK